MLSRTSRRCGVLLCVMLASWPRAVPAQFRGSRPVAREPDYGWWLSGGANAVVLGDIVDGRSNTRWTFGSDPLWQMRGTLEKALDDGSTLGLAAGYGLVDVNLSRLYDTSTQPGTSGPCATACQAQTQLWSAMAQFRSGGGQRGFHTLFLLSGGATGFRAFRERATGDSVPGLQKLQADLSGALGGGVGYALSSGLAVELIQDFGIGWHSKTGLADGQGRTWRSRTTRAGLRFQFGGNR